MLLRVRTALVLVVLAATWAAASAVAARPTPVTGREWKAVFTDWFAHGRLAASHSCAAVVVARTHAPPRYKEGSRLVHAFDVYERSTCLGSSRAAWMIKVGMSN